MFSNKFLRQEVYCIPLDSGNTLIYAPLTRFFAIYEGAVAKADIIRDIPAEAISPKEIPEFVRKRGFVLDSSKIRLRLNVTSECNLHCSYCSVNANNFLVSVKNMPDSVAFAAVDFFTERTLKEKKDLEIVFSGGEPTLKLGQIEKIIQFALNKMKDRPKRVSFRLITNGIFSWSKMEPIVHLFREIQVSWDGVFPNHPRYGKKYLSMNNKVMQNIRRLLNAGLPVSVLVVVTEQNYRILRDIVDTLYKVGVRHIFLALKDSLGRSKSQEFNVDEKVLSTLYLELWKYYRDIDVNINLGGTDIHSISPFPCSIPAPNYSISPNGAISSCTTTFNDNSEYVNDFRIGFVDNYAVNLDNKAISRMKKFNVQNIPECLNCFAKWHCRGGCIYSKQGNWFSPLRSSTCSLLRSIIVGKILTIIDE